MTKMNQTIVTIILFALSGSVAACALEPGGSEDDFDPAEPTTEGKCSCAPWAGIDPRGSRGFGRHFGV